MDKIFIVWYLVGLNAGWALGSLVRYPLFKYNSHDVNDDGNHDR